MPSPPEPRLSNRLIESVVPRERKKILESLETIDLARGDILCEPHRPFLHVYFPLNVLISVVSGVSGHPPLEVAMLGSEGMLGPTLVLGVNFAMLRAIVQGSGKTLRMSAAGFQRGLSGWPSLRGILNCYVCVVMAQRSRGAACARFHELDARLARSLLMAHDRAHADTFFLTHETLAAMLGMRRSGVTIAAGLLQSKGLIGYSRGYISITDRAGLEAESCECYRALIDDYDRLLK